MPTSERTKKTTALRPPAEDGLRYHLAEDTIDRSEVDRLVEWLKGYPHLTKGPLTVQFEAKWARWLGRKYSVFCNSGSSANLLMYYVLLASGRLKNKKVVVPSCGWITSVAPAIQFGFEPIMCETDPETFGLDLNHLEKILKQDKPQTVVLVQPVGVPHKMKDVMKLKEKYGFFLLEDTCAAVGSETSWAKAGTFGDLSAFSFYFGHQASTIEGGMVCTDDAELCNLLFMLRSHGWSKDLDETSHARLVKKHEVDDFHRPFIFYEPGFNLRSTDLNAFIGIGQVDKMGWVVSRRHANHMLYKKKFEPRLRVQTWNDPGAKISSIQFAVLAESTAERRKVVEALDANAIESRIFTAGHLGWHPFWYTRFGKPKFPVAERLYRTGLFLPNHPVYEASDIEFIADVVLEAVSRSRK